MPGATPYEAFQAFVGPLQSALSCVASCKLSASSGGMHKPDAVHHLLGNAGEQIVLDGDYRLRLQFRMKYKIVNLPDLEAGPFKIRTVAYSYTVTDASGGGVLAYHWHPDGTSHVDSPHLHIDTAQLSTEAVLTAKSHLPTGRISVEQVVRSLITEHKVTPKTVDWVERLTLTDGVFQLYKSWG